MAEEGKPACDAAEMAEGARRASWAVRERGACG